MNISERDFTRALKNSWSRETSGDPEHRSDTNPSYRQCLVTALLANEVLGLDIYTEKVSLESGLHGAHYFNKDSNSMEVRFCDEQFASEKNIKRKNEKKKDKERRKTCLFVYPTIKHKYTILKRRFQSELRRNLLKDVINYLLERRSDCVDDLPPCAVSFDDPKYYSYKCRTNRWTSISTRMQMLMKQLPNISEDTKSEMLTFCAYAKALDGAEFRTPEEIQQANIILDNIITLLKDEQVIARYRSLTIERIQK